VALELEVVLEDGRVVRRAVTIDAETGEIRAIPPTPGPAAADPGPALRREPPPEPRGVATLFTTRLATLDARDTPDLALLDRALARAHDIWNSGGGPDVTIRLP
jgi:hypothetical protein